jgi:hypothetical protein
MNQEYKPRMFKQRLVFATLALLASTTTIALAILAPLATHGGLA